MPITSAAKKYLRQSLRRKARNDLYREKLKKLLKQVRFLISQKKKKEAKELFPEVSQILDKSAKVGLIKKNTASRKKSRIAQAINKLG